MTAFMYNVIATKKYVKSLQKIIKSGLKKNIDKELKEAVTMLALGQKLSPLYRDHKLHGEFEGYRECHIEGDLLLVYQIIDKELVLVLVDVGSHSELFG